MGRINVTSSIFEGPSGPNLHSTSWCPDFRYKACKLQRRALATPGRKRTVVIYNLDALPRPGVQAILAEGAIALSVTLSGGALFAS